MGEFLNVRLNTIQDIEFESPVFLTFLCWHSLILFFFFLDVSAPSPLSNITAPARGVVTMRCDVCTSASARISLLVAGRAHICLDDQVSNKIVLGVPKSSFLQRCKLIAAQQYIHYALLKIFLYLKKISFMKGLLILHILNSC